MSMPKVDQGLRWNVSRDHAYAKPHLRVTLVDIADNFILGEGLVNVAEFKSQTRIIVAVEQRADLILADMDRDKMIITVLERDWNAQT